MIRVRSVITVIIGLSAIPPFSLSDASVPASVERFTVAYPVPPEIKTVLKVMDAIDRRDANLLKPENYTLEVQQAFRAAVGFDERPPVPDASDFAKVAKYHGDLVFMGGYEEKSWGYRQLRACADDEGTAFLTHRTTLTGGQEIISKIIKHLRSPKFGFDGALSDYLQKNPLLLPLPPLLGQYVFLVLSGYASRHVLFLLDCVLIGEIPRKPDETLADTAYRDLQMYKGDNSHAYAVEYVVGFARRHGLLEG